MLGDFFVSPTILKYTGRIAMLAAEEAQLSKRIGKLTAAAWRRLSKEKKAALATEGPCSALLYESLEKLEIAEENLTSLSTVSDTTKIRNAKTAFKVTKPSGNIEPSNIFAQFPVHNLDPSVGNIDKLKQGMNCLSIHQCIG